MASRFSRVGPVQRREVRRHEHLAAVFYYRVGYQLLLQADLPAAHASG